MSLSILSGATGECLAHFFKRYRWEELQSFLAEWANINKDTVRRWKNGTLPLGDELVRVRALLDLLGYEVREFTILPQPTRQFAQAIALGLISVEEATELLGYKNPNGVFDLVLRGRGLMPHRQFRLERYVENSSQEIREALDELRAKTKLLPLDGSELPQENQAAPEPPALAISEASTTKEAPRASQQPVSWPEIPLEVLDLARDIIHVAQRTKDMLDGPEGQKYLRSFQSIISQQEVEVLVGQLKRLGSMG